MAKGAEKKKTKKKAKKKERDLADRLRRLGLPKKSAKTVAGSVTNVKGQLPASARSAIDELLSKVDELRGRGSEKSKPAGPEAELTESDGKTDQAKKAGKKKAGKKAKKGARETQA